MRFTCKKWEESHNEYGNCVDMTGKSIYNVREYGYITQEDVELFCLANEGTGFELLTKYSIATWRYESTLFSGQRKIKSDIKEYGQEQMAKACFPQGVQVRSSLSDVPQTSTRGMETQYIQYNVEVPRVYVDSVNKHYKAVFSKHSQIISQMVRNGINKALSTNSNVTLNNLVIEVRSSGIFFRTHASYVMLYRILFDSLGMVNLPNYVYQFALAKEVANAVVNQQKDKMEFDEINLCCSAGIEISFKVKSHNLNNW